MFEDDVPNVSPDIDAIKNLLDSYYQGAQEYREGDITKHEIAKAYGVQLDTALKIMHKIAKEHPGEWELVSVIAPSRYRMIVLRKK